MNPVCTSALLLVLLLSACAAPQTQAEVDEQVCTREYPTGYAVAVTKCRSKADLAKEREAAAEAGRNVKPSASPPPAGGERR